MKGLSRDSLWDAGLFHFAATLVWVFGISEISGL